jgi:hypothetical protein
MAKSAPAPAKAAAVSAVWAASPAESCGGLRQCAQRDPAFQAGPGGIGENRVEVVEGPAGLEDLDVVGRPPHLEHVSPDRVLRSRLEREAHTARLCRAPASRRPSLGECRSDGDDDGQEGGDGQEEHQRLDHRARQVRVTGHQEAPVGLAFWPSHLCPTIIRRQRAEGFRCRGCTICRRYSCGAQQGGVQSEARTEGHDDHVGPHLGGPPSLDLLHYE